MSRDYFAEDAPFEMQAAKAQQLLAAKTLHAQGNTDELYNLLCMFINMHFDYRYIMEKKLRLP